MTTEGPLVYWDHDIDRDATISVSCNWCESTVLALVHGSVYPDGWRLIDEDTTRSAMTLLCPRCVAERLPE